MSGIGPLAVWDCHSRRYGEIRDPVCAYLASQGLPIDPAYRVEVYLVDVPFARCFTYAEDEQGRRYVDPQTGEAAVREPYDRPLTALPPAGIRVLL